MPNSIIKDPLLSIARIFLLFIQGILAIGAAASLIAIPIVLFYREKLLFAIAEDAPRIPSPETVWIIAGVLVLAMIMLVLAYLFTDKLRRITETVGAGDPFVPENAVRLTTMAWFMLVIQALSIPVAGLALYLTKLIEPHKATVDAGMDLNGIILVVILFILARVFRKGSEMRDDLEGTV